MGVFRDDDLSKQRVSRIAVGGAYRSWTIHDYILLDFRIKGLRGKEVPFVLFLTYYLDTSKLFRVVSGSGHRSYKALDSQHIEVLGKVLPHA